MNTAWIAQYACHDLHACQSKEELAGLLSLIDTEQPQHLLEIGTSNGATYYAFAQTAPSTATLLSCDYGPLSPVGHRYATSETLCSFLKPEQTGHQVWGNSQDPATFEAVRDLMPVVDFLFIDADHHYEAVQADHELYSPLVQPGGIIAFHDINHHNHETHVDLYWSAIRPTFQNRVWEWRSGLGIGAYQK